jgi:hypothetical protein
MLPQIAGENFFVAPFQAKAAETISSETTTLNISRVETAQHTKMLSSSITAQFSSQNEMPL